ncbi:MAG: saccharopine dehydrogenase NADP-binding domain-containing protein [Gemmatimonadota bacterium]
MTDTTEPGKPVAAAGDWLLYGAYGYTGRLLAKEAVTRGHRPILAGRRLEPLQTLREELGQPLELRPFPLDEPQRLDEGLRGVRGVLHAAGPFVETAEPMMDACLRRGVHYLDITGEVPVFEAAFSRDPEAKRRGIVFMPGVGLDVIPTDGVAARLHLALPTARRLELALHSPGRPSSGTMQTIVEAIPKGLQVRRDGVLQGARPMSRSFRRKVDFGPEKPWGPMKGRMGGERSVAPYTWGDLATAWRTTGIPDITCYLSTPPAQARILPWALPVLRIVLQREFPRRWARRRIAGGAEGPSEHQRNAGRTRAWGRVEDDSGGAAEMVVEFPEGYRFTAEAGVRAMEGVLEATVARSDTPCKGTLTPAGAFGAHWIFRLPGVEVVVEPG